MRKDFLYRGFAGYTKNHVYRREGGMLGGVAHIHDYERALTRKVFSYEMLFEWQDRHIVTDIAEGHDP